MTEKSKHTKTASSRDADNTNTEFGNGKFDRISGQTKGLVDDVKEWVDLRLKLVQLDLEDRIDVIANQAILTVIVAFIGGTSGIFALFAAAFGLGQLIGNTALGFLSISGLLALITFVMHKVRPKFINNVLLSVARKGQSVAEEDVKLQIESDEQALKPQLPEAKQVA